jgi:insertion element IS1 protein InsB
MKMEYIASDYWRAYESIIPKEKHIQTKAETFTVEGYNSLFRHFLARMRRKTQRNLGLIRWSTKARKQKWRKSGSDLTK